MRDRPVCEKVRDHESLLILCICFRTGQRGRSTTSCSSSRYMLARFRTRKINLEVYILLLPVVKILNSCSAAWNTVSKDTGVTLTNMNGGSALNYLLLVRRCSIHRHTLMLILSIGIYQYLVGACCQQDWSPICVSCVDYHYRCVVHLGRRIPWDTAVDAQQRHEWYWDGSLPGNYSAHCRFPALPVETRLTSCVDF